MADHNILYAVFDQPGKQAVVTPRAWQWDTGQILRIQGLPITTGTEVHFNMDGTTITTVAGVTDGIGYAAIPDVIFEEPGTVAIYIYLREDASTAETLYSAILGVMERPQPEDYDPPTEQEERIFQEAVAAVQAAAEAADDAAVLSESWAIGGTGTRPGEDYNNSKFWAKMAEEQAAEGGFVYFEIAYPGYLMMTRSDNLDDDITFSLTEAGDLEVTLS